LIDLYEDDLSAPAWSESEAMVAFG
jgi:hypothetical protein